LLAICLFVELLFMLALSRWITALEFEVMLFDAVLLTLVLTPAAYALMVRPLTAQLATQMQLMEEREMIWRQRLAGLEQAVIALGDGIERRDQYKVGHHRRVARLAAALGEALGLDQDSLSCLRTAARIHDIGIVAVPVDILNRHAALTRPEMELVRSHAQVGHDLLENTGLAEPVADILLQHHERLDGSGYPAGLKAGAILPEARILAVADVVEAMTHDRAYREAHKLDVALAEIETHRGSWYAPEVVDACLHLFRDTGFVLDGTNEVDRVVRQARQCRPGNG